MGGPPGGGARHGKKRARPNDTYLLSHADLLARKRELLPGRKLLPIYAVRDQLMAQVEKHAVLIVVGETGSGKSTQLPQFILGAGLAGDAQVAITQPRRVATTTVARRVAEEQGVPLGGRVGYSIRFEDVSSSETRLRFLTDGMLLREALLDPDLAKYKVIILDEAHERTLHTDVLLGLLKRLHARRSDLKIVVMSATLDFGQFQTFFPGSKALAVEGRQHKVQTMYLRTPEEDYLDAALLCVTQVHTEEGAGDILLFLTGQEEIENMERLIRQRAAHLPNLLKLQLVPVRAPPYRDLFDALVHLSTLLKLEHQAQNAISGP